VSISTTGFYGLHRDFLNMIPTGYTAFTAQKARDHQSLDPEAQSYKQKKQAQREAWRKQKLRAKANRVNRLMPQACTPSGEAIQRAAIRKELEAA